MNLPIPLSLPPPSPSLLLSPPPSWWSQLKLCHAAGSDIQHVGPLPSAYWIKYDMTVASCHSKAQLHVKTSVLLCKAKCACVQHDPDEIRTFHDMKEFSPACGRGCGIQGLRKK